jgi:hypothetical protein
MQLWVGFVRAAAKKYSLDAAIILGIVQVETSGNNVIGDYGHGHGLMQIDDRSHKAWLETHDNGLDPESNIDYGSAILRANIDYFNGDVRAGVAACNCGAATVRAALDESGDPDKYTTGGHYSTRVLGWAEVFRPDLDEDNNVLIPQQIVDRFQLAGAHDINGLIASYEGIVQGAHEQGVAAAVIPAEYIEKYQLSSAHDVPGLIAKLESAVRSAREQGYAEGRSERP